MDKYFLIGMVVLFVALNFGKQIYNFLVKLKKQQDNITAGLPYIAATSDDNKPSLDPNWVPAVHDIVEKWEELKRMCEISGRGESVKALDHVFLKLLNTGDINEKLNK